MAKILVVYCSLTGNTQAGAEAVAAGAAEAGAEVIVKSAAEAQPEDLAACDAVALGSYDAFSYMGGGLKDFLDRAYHPTQATVTGKPYAAFVTHGGGGRAIGSIEQVAQTFKLERAAESVLVKGLPDEAARADLQALGAKLAAAAEAGGGGA